MQNNNVYKYYLLTSGKMIEKLIGYALPGNGALFLGHSKEQIQSTVKYYISRGQKVPLPKDYDYLCLEKIIISCFQPIFSPKHFFNAEITPQVQLEVNANAYFDIQIQLLEYEKAKRGDLYKFVSGLPAPVIGVPKSFTQIFFLPEDVMIAGRDYNWDKHKPQIEQWSGIREAVLQEGEEKGLIARAHQTKH